MNLFDNLFSICAYIVRQKRLPNLISPRSLSDKILHLKLNPNHKLSGLRKLAADRIKVRDYVAEKSQSVQLIPLVWSGMELTEEVWTTLPEKFVIKANHGSKMVEIVEKSKANYEEIVNLTSKWKEIDYYKKGREWVYKDIERSLVVEQFIEFADDVPPDFKFFCLNGKVSFVQVDLDRFIEHTRNIYDRDFRLLDIEYNFPKGHEIDKPNFYDHAVSIAEELSIDFDFVRVDLYILDDGVYFGELTNFPGNCLERFRPYSFDLETGLKLKI